ncbi:iron complex outermembrane receptor protein [Tenacibaculum adriaticum]|uniref:Iron complex outermembrane receptor protein n=1 Tax=Tenacibaculum adriaticum TaxID=413713 RepID=A0A5S5DTE8_9FLAO|nr:TonB-dependent receptor [Tenacibaculum adriaticum]TYP99147.1 iron complex outermembrane receptor protein [Tenacibaculum adriaticum]
MTKSKVLFILVLFIHVTIKAQECNYTFNGVVEDFHDKTAISDAVVYVKNQNKFTTTDVNGNFSFKNICKGKIIVEISHVACDTKRLEFYLNENTFKEILIEHHIEELETVTIKSNSILKTTQESVLKTSAIENLSDASLGDVLKQISGVSSINTGSSIVKPIINGLHSSRNLIMVNGVRLQDQDWGIEHAPNIDVNAAGSISVIKGANALEYGGDAIGGVVIVNPENIITKDTLSGKTIISQQSNARSFSVNSSLRKSYKSGWFVNGLASYKRYGDANTPDYSLTNTGLNSKSFTLQTGYKSFEKGFELYYSYITNEIGILKASHLGNTADLVNAINSPQPLLIKDFSYDINNPKQDVTHQLTKAIFYKRFRGLGKLNFQYDYQDNHRFEYDIRTGDDKFKPSIDLRLKTHTVKADLKLDSNIERILKIGILAGYQNNFPNSETGVRRLIPDYDKIDFGIYTIGNFTFDNLKLSGGLRYDYNYINSKKYYYKSRWDNLGYNQTFASFIIKEEGNQYLTNPIFHYHNFSASAGASYKLNDKNTILLNYGLAKRPPNPSELFSDGLHHSASRIELGDLSIQPETSHRIGASYMFSNAKFNSTLEVFFNQISNFIFIEPGGIETTLRGSFPVWNYKQTNARLTGVDLTMQYLINSNWALNNNTSYILGDDLLQNRPLIDMPPFKTVNSIAYNNKKWLNFTSTLESEFVGKQTRYPNNNFYAYIPTTDSTVLVDISSTPKAYHLLNISNEISFKYAKTNFSLGFSVNNILNTSYRNYLNRLRYFSDDLGRNFKIQLKIKY